jgi:hypothetical protein
MSHYRMMRYLVVPLALVALAVSGCQSGAPAQAQAAGGVSNSARLSATPSTTPSPTSTPTPSRVISPDLQIQTTCSVASGKYPGMSTGIHFTAESTVVNQGNIGASVRLRVTWIGTSTVYRVQKVTVGYGQHKKVTFNAPTTPASASAFEKAGTRRCGAIFKVLAIVGNPSPTK